MMNEISKLINFVIYRFSNDVLVNTISIVKTFELDANKENIYPLVNIHLKDIDVLDAVKVASFEITILQQRDIKPIKTDSKLLLNTNLIDNINETSAIASNFINYLSRFNNDLNVEINDQTTLSVLQNFGGNGLDGVQFTIDLSIHNSACADA